MEKKIKWQTGKPNQTGTYIVSLINGKIDTEELVSRSNFNDDKLLFFWSFYEDEDIQAWCKLSDIEPYDDNDNDNDNNNFSFENLQDGDICFAKIKELEDFDFIFIYKISERKEDVIRHYAVCSFYRLYMSKGILCKKKSLNKLRLASEEEKQKLFKEFQNRGYRWNEKTKTFNKLKEFKKK